MTVDFENLNEIPKLVALVEELIQVQKEGCIEKKWLSVRECANYLGCKEEAIYKYKEREWNEGIHYCQPISKGRLFFCKEKIDEWVKYGSEFDLSKISEKIISTISNAKNK